MQEWRGRVLVVRKHNPSSWILYSDFSKPNLQEQDTPDVRERQAKVYLFRPAAAGIPAAKPA
jgi:hypothetical protein